MAEIYDAAARLAEGRPAVETVQSYVWASHLLGYDDADLTLHAAQVREWYGSEDGIDLRVLDADCAALSAAVAVVEEVLGRQDAQAAVLSTAWQGAGATASQEFLRRHADASSSAAAAVRAAAESLAALRDRLWRAVDGKVTATTMVEAGGTRGDWVAAAETVITGAGDRATASELVDQEVKPFVSNDIRTNWLEAMRSAVAEIIDAYDAAVGELTSEADVVFDIPGDLGPATATPAMAGPPAVSAAPPVAWSAPPATQPTPAPAVAPAPAPAVAPAPAPPSVEPAAMAQPSMPPMPSLGGGMPDVGGGLSGFGQQLGDLLGGLLGTTDDAPPDPPELDEPDLDEPEDSESDIGPEIEEPGADAPCEPPQEDPPVEPPPPVDEPPTEPPPPTGPPAPVEPAPTPAPLPPPAPPEPASATGTPCEIAADELPQVGE